ncbi:hypothetical protein [Mycolicibacterium conceptionense]|uniref:hypothetical protein n=1 Tax=Mycolicibacterium conceptionense TaxID=451644 RepID=UPI000A4AB558|nr:hypothetical protein [Mycolicibacterium conceptionense]
MSQFTATHPDLADVLTVDTDSVESARAIAAEQFAVELGVSVDVAAAAIDVSEAAA